MNDKLIETAAVLGIGMVLGLLIIFALT